MYVRKQLADDPGREPPRTKTQTRGAYSCCSRSLPRRGPATAVITHAFFVVILRRFSRDPWLPRARTPRRWTWQDNRCQRMLKTKSCGRPLAMDCFTQCFRHATLSIERRLNCWDHYNSQTNKPNAMGDANMRLAFMLQTARQIALLRSPCIRRCSGHIPWRRVPVPATAIRRVRKNARERARCVGAMCPLIQALSGHPCFSCCPHVSLAGNTTTLRERAIRTASRPSRIPMTAHRSTAAVAANTR